MIRRTVLATCILLGGLAQAQEEIDPEYVDALGPHPWMLAPEVYYFNYEEPGVMEDTGWFTGLIASHTHRADSGFSFKVEGRFAWGEVDYDGGISDPNGGSLPYEIEDIEDFVAGLGLLWGWETDRARFIDGFHAGIAYRYLNDDTSFDPAGYERESNYLYIPLRLHATAGSTRAWQVGFTGELDIMIVGLQISHLGDAGFTESNVYNWQYGGLGGQFAIAVRHRSESLDIAFGPFVRAWWIPESEEDEGYVEPKNRTVEVGMNLIFQF